MTGTAGLGQDNNSEEETTGAHLRFTVGFVEVGHLPRVGVCGLVSPPRYLVALVFSWRSMSIADCQNDT